MSFKVMTWAMNQKPKGDFKPLTKFVLMHLADLADQDGKSYPSLRYLSESTGLSPSTVRKHLHTLAEAGLVEIVWGKRSDGSYSANTYYLNTGEGTPRELEGTPRELQGTPRETVGVSPGNSRCNDPAIDPLYIFIGEAGIEKEWEAFKAMRKQIKKPMTPYAAGKLINKLQRIRKETGDQYALLLDQSTINCWQDVFPLRRGRKDSGASTFGTPGDAWEKVPAISQEKLGAFCALHNLPTEPSPGVTFDEWRRQIITQLKEQSHG